MAAMRGSSSQQSNAPQTGVLTTARPPGSMGRVSQAAAVALGQAPQGAIASVPADAHAQLLQLQREKAELKQRLGEQEGTNSILRANLDRAERERIDLRRQLQESSKPPPNGMASYSIADLQKQSDTLRQQLAFTEQEVEDTKRRNHQRDERLKVAEAKAAALQEEINKAEAVKAQLSIELEEANRERRERAAGASTSGAADVVMRPACSPPARVAGAKRRAGSGQEAGLGLSGAATVASRQIQGMARASGASTAATNGTSGDISSLLSAGLHLSSRVHITQPNSLGPKETAAPASAAAESTVKPDDQSALARLTRCWEGLPKRDDLGHGMLRLLLSHLDQGAAQAESSSAVAAALGALTALVQCAPAARGREIMAPVMLSGLLERHGGAHPAAYLAMLHLLLENEELCQMLGASLAQTGADQQQDQTGLAGPGLPQPMDTDQPDAAQRWTGGWAVLQPLLNCLSLPLSLVAKLPGQPATSQQATQHSAQRGRAGQGEGQRGKAASSKPPDQVHWQLQPEWWADTHAPSEGDLGAVPAFGLAFGGIFGPFLLQRRATALIAALLAHQRYTILLPLLTEDAHSSPGRLMNWQAPSQQALQHTLPLPLAGWACAIGSSSQPQAKQINPHLGVRGTQGHAAPQQQPVPDPAVHRDVVVTANKQPQQDGQLREPGEDVHGQPPGQHGSRQGGWGLQTPQHKRAV
ncbi:hypothetical protein WJX72_011090 [[Myrmecia] bisecta]|uniref:Uncharacterized protein n=1 Tax=[Myrmecia] bisecta TaxID=41462 RepID=A0AAW1PI24_9CHLO